MGYGSRAMELLRDYYSGKFTDISESTELNDHTITRVTDSELANASLKDEIKLRDVKTLPPLLLKLSEKAPYYLHYLGVLWFHVSITQILEESRVHSSLFETNT